MPEVRKRFRYCSYLLAVVAATSCLFGVVYCLATKPMPYHLAFVGMSFEKIKNSNPFPSGTSSVLGSRWRE